MVEITYQMVLSTLQTVALIVGITYYLFIMRNSQKTRELALNAQEQALETRQTQLFMDVYRSHTTKEHQADVSELLLSWDWNDFDDFKEKYMVPPDNAKYLSYFANLEGLGLLVRNGLLDANLVYDLQYVSIIMIWEKFLPIILEYREAWSTPQLWGTVEYLYDEMKRIRVERSHGETTIE